MAAGLEPWIYISRGLCAFAVIIVILVLDPALSRFGIARAVCYKPPLVFSLLFFFLLVLYIGDFTAFVVESLSWGELPDITASLSDTIFTLTIAIHLELLTAPEKTCVWYIHFISWLFLHIVELLTAIRLGLRPSSLSPYYELGIVLSSSKALTYIGVLVFFFRAHREGYKSLPQSDLENSDATPESLTTEDSDDDATFPLGAAVADDLEITMEAKQEVKKLGGWWPFLKKFRIFLEYMWPFGELLLQLRFILVFIIILAQRVIGVYQPLQAAALLDAVASGIDPWGPLLVLVVLNVVNSKIFLASINALLWIDVSLHRTKNLKVKVQSKIMGLDSYFHSAVHPTEVIKAVDYAGSVDRLLDSFIFGFVPNAVTLVIATDKLLNRYGPFMMIIITYMATFYCLVEKRSLVVLTRERDKYITVRNNQERRRQDGVRGWSTVSNHNRVEHETNVFESEVKSWIGQWRRYNLFLYAFQFIQSFLLQFGYTAGYAFVIYKIRSGKATIGDLVAFTGLWTLLLGPVNYFTSIVGNLLEDILDAARLRRILERNSRIPEGDKALEYVKGEVEFRDVSASYPGSKSKSIDNVRITIEGGSKVAFVGPTGVGKSTIFKLLMRMLAPDEGGAILIDGQDIKMLSTKSLHENVGMMPQNAYIFNRTIMENMKYARLDATDGEVHEACRKAGIHETIMARSGQYNAPMGENGDKFSGGERQRFLLARLFIQKPKIVLIDEGTSALDAETEATIKQSIDQEFAGQTVIIVAHRLSSIRHVDRILVLGKGGKVVEDGNHDELVAKNGDYAKYWKMHIGEAQAPLVDVSC